MTKTDDIYRKYSKKKVNLRVEKMYDEYILIEGDKNSLEFLGNLLIAQANDKEECKTSISPMSSGSAFFDKRKSKFGFYIHRLPCEHGKIDKRKITKN